MRETARETPSKTLRSPRRRLIVLAIASSPLWLGVGVFVYLQQGVNARLRKAIEAANRDDPNWRLADLEAHRVGVAPAENSALRAQAVVGMLPRGWLDRNAGKNDPESAGRPSNLDVYDDLSRLEPDAPIPAIVAYFLREKLADKGEAIASARRLSDMGEGYYPLKYNNIWIATLLPHIQETRNAARLLQIDAIARVEAGDGDGALESCRAIVGVARSIGDEPIVISQLVRMANDNLAIQSLERVLARGVGSRASLATLQRDLAREGSIPFLLNGVRGERAGMFDVTEKISSGAIAPSSLRGLTGTSADAYLQVPMHIGAFNRYNQALLLDYMNRGVAICRRPVGEQPALWAEWERATKPGGGLSEYIAILATSLKTDLKAAADGQLRTVARLRAAVAALAIERFRLARGRWPDRLDQLVPEFLDAVPADPYSGGPLRLVLRDGKRIVYAVGPDGIDDGGKLQAPGTRPGTGPDVGFRLIEPGDRRRLAPELPKDVFSRESTRSGP